MLSCRSPPARCSSASPPARCAAGRNCLAEVSRRCMALIRKPGRGQWPLLVHTITRTASRKRRTGRKVRIVANRRECWRPAGRRACSHRPLHSSSASDQPRLTDHPISDPQCRCRPASRPNPNAMTSSGTQKASAAPQKCRTACRLLLGMHTDPLPAPSTHWKCDRLAAPACIAEGAYRLHGTRSKGVWGEATAVGGPPQQVVAHPRCHR